MKVLIRRLLPVWVCLVSIEILLALFAGMGYFLLGFSLFIVILNTAFYLDFIYIALFGKEYHSKQADNIAKTRKLKSFLIGTVVTEVIFLSMSVFLILNANVKLIDYI